MAYEVKIILDSANPYTGERITTLTATYPRIVHDELLTHRAFSRNAASSRAIPIAQQIQQVILDPYIPESWGREQRGMVAGEEIVCPKEALRLWLEAHYNVARAAAAMQLLGVHKEGISPLLMPFSWITTLITSTEWDNFFQLRCAADARPPLRKLALMMRDAISESKPQSREAHIPFLTSDDASLGESLQLARSVARCCRISYLNHEGQSDIAADVRLFERERKAAHWSPFEHQAWAMLPGDFANRRSGNFTGWTQYRQILEGRGA